MMQKLLFFKFLIQEKSTDHESSMLLLWESFWIIQLLQLQLVLVVKIDPLHQIS